MTEYHNKYCERFLLCSDEDQPVVEELTVCVNTVGQLIAKLERTDYTGEDDGSVTRMIVDPDDTLTLAASHGVSPAGLPDYIADCMEVWTEIANPTFDDVRECFQEIGNCLLDEGYHYRIETRTAGKSRPKGL